MTAAPPDGKVKLPGIGQVKKSTAIAGAALVAGLALVIYVRSKQHAAKEGTYDPNAINPVTGYPFGSPQDTAAIAALNAAGSSPTTGGGTGSSSGDGTSEPTGDRPRFDSNAAWAQYVESYLAQNQGADPRVVGRVIGAYITGGTITPAERDDVVNNAIAIADYPPVHGPAGFPPSMHVSAPAPTPKPAWRYAAEGHHTGAHPVGGRQFIIGLSASGAPAVNIEAALQATVKDPKNARYRAYYGSHAGKFPPNVIISTHVVKRG